MKPGVKPLPSYSEARARAAAGELLAPADMAAIWKIGRTQFAKLNREGAFDAFRARPAIGRCCFSGVLVDRYVNGEPVYQPTFGRKKRA